MAHIKYYENYREKHTPVPDEAMKAPVNPDGPEMHTICAVFRDIYHRTDDPQIKYWARHATAMAKSMVQKLAYYYKLHENENNG